jgi:hypothetical protein
VALARIAIEEFVAMVHASVDAQRRVARVGNDVHAIAGFACENGFAFSGDDFGQYITEQLDAKLSPKQKQARAKALRAANGGATFSDRDHQPRIVRLDAASPFTLDRAPILAGDLVILEGSSAFAALAQGIRRHLMAAFGDAVPTTTHRRLDEQAYYACVRQVDEDLSSDPAVPVLIADLVRSLGWSPRTVGYFGPFVRHNLPPAADEGVVGYFSHVPVRVQARSGALLNAHRDTWFGAPFHQLNLWAPLYPYPARSGLVLLPRLFSRSLRNNTEGFDVWRAQLGYAVGPMCLDEVDGSDEIHADLSVGELMVFSANHFHGTGVNPGPASRISVELRLTCEEDRQNGVRSPNVDFHGAGELSEFRVLPS